MTNEELKSSMISILLGEGGLFSDFTPESSDKSFTFEMNILGDAMRVDTAFADQIATELVKKYKEICAMRGIRISSNINSVLSTYQCCLHALRIYRVLQNLKNQERNEESLSR